MFKRTVTISRAKVKPTVEGWEANVTAKAGDTELKFVAGGKGEVPAWVREDKELNLTIEVDRDSDV